MVSLLNSYSKKYDSNQYGKSDYWEDRYQREKPEDVFDWYIFYASNGRTERIIKGEQSLRDIIFHEICADEELPTTCPILNVGAGNSRMSEEMLEEGYTNITSIDISFFVVKNMI